MSSINPNPNEYFSCCLTVCIQGYYSITIGLKYIGAIMILKLK